MFVNILFNSLISHKAQVSLQLYAESFKSLKNNCWHKTLMGHMQNFDGANESFLNFF